MSGESFFTAINAGRLDYATALRMQRGYLDAVSAGACGNILMICSHDPVVTVGRCGSRAHILASPQELARQGIRVCDTDRGGDVTYHGPGQLTVYPIFHLDGLRKDLRWFLRSLEIVIMRFLDGFRIRACVRDGLRGVWVGDEKIASIGIAVRRWVTYHGFSINVGSEDLAGFAAIRPCGMDIRVTTMEQQGGMRYAHAHLARGIARECRDVVFGRGGD